MRAAANGRMTFRAWIGACLVGLMLVVSGAPCTGLASPIVDRAAVNGPADPCKSGGAAAPATCCVQAACQVMSPPPPGGAASPAPYLSRARYELPTTHFDGRRDAPPTPPPRVQ